ncbi:vesicle-associated membrane protein 8, isoform CRA_a, partial [Mus musculus]
TLQDNVPEGGPEVLVEECEDDCHHLCDCPYHRHPHYTFCHWYHPHLRVPSIPPYSSGVTSLICAKRSPLLSSSTQVLLSPCEGLLLHQMPQTHLDPLGGDSWTVAASHGPESGLQRPRGPCLWLGNCWWLVGNKDLLVSL